MMRVSFLLVLCLCLLQSTHCRRSGGGSYSSSSSSGGSSGSRSSSGGGWSSGSSSSSGSRGGSSSGGGGWNIGSSSSHGNSGGSSSSSSSGGSRGQIGGGGWNIGSGGSSSSGGNHGTSSSGGNHGTSSGSGNRGQIGGGGWSGGSSGSSGGKLGSLGGIFGNKDKSSSGSSKGGKYKTLKKAAVVGAAAYGGYKIGKLTNRFRKFGQRSNPGYSFNDWNAWRAKDGFLCRSDSDCKWIDPSLECDDYKLDFSPSNLWFGGDVASIRGQCQCRNSYSWNDKNLHCLQRPMFSYGGSGKVRGGPVIVLIVSVMCLVTWR